MLAIGASLQMRNIDSQLSALKQAAEHAEKLKQLGMAASTFEEPGSKDPNEVMLHCRLMSSKMCL